MRTWIVKKKKKIYFYYCIIGTQDGTSHIVGAQ